MSGRHDQDVNGRGSGPHGSNPHGGQVLVGILRLASLQAEGMAEFGNSRHAFLNSLAPLVAFPLVGGLLGVLSGGGLEAVDALLGTLVALLAPLVLSEVLARVWGRNADWLRYATAFNWTRWAMVLALGGALVVMGALVTAGMDPQAALALSLSMVGGYSMVLDCFVARVGLRLTWWRAALLVLTVNAGSAALFLGPHLLAGTPDAVPA